jgi:hypothetical protein
VGDDGYDSPWAAWFESVAPAEVIAWDDTAVADAAASVVVVFLPELPRGARDEAARIAGHGGPVLGMGVGGARAYGGLDLGLGLADGAQGAVDGMIVADPDHALFAGMEIPEDRDVTVYTAAVTDVGIRPSDGVEVLGWDDRYEGSYADLCHNGEAWFWGWGGEEDGLPDELTPEGDAVLRALVTSLI